MLTQARLQELAVYDPVSGIFTRRISRGKWRAGSRMGSKMVSGYIAIHVDGRDYYAHRLAFLYMCARFPDGTIDHVNGDRGDNRFTNLRDVREKVNHENQRRAKSDNKLGVLGVHFDAKRNRYVAQVQSGDVRVGRRFKTLAEATAYYLETKRRLHVGCTI